MQAAHAETMQLALQELARNLVQLHDCGVLVHWDVASQTAHSVVAGQTLPAMIAMAAAL